MGTVLVMEIRRATKAGCRRIANAIGAAYHLDARACEALYHFFLVQRRGDPVLIQQVDMALKVYAYVATSPSEGNKL